MDNKTYKKQEKDIKQRDRRWTIEKKKKVIKGFITVFTLANIVVALYAGSLVYSILKTKFNMNNPSQGIIVDNQGWYTIRMGAHMVVTAQNSTNATAVANGTQLFTWDSATYEVAPNTVQNVTLAMPDLATLDPTNYQRLIYTNCTLQVTFSMSVGIGVVTLTVGGKYNQTWTSPL